MAIVRGNWALAVPQSFVLSERSDIGREIFPNGLVLITEPMPHVRSVSVGIWVRTGSRREPAEQNGISHFIEHMVFKGTERRSAEEIARSVDALGGMLDAFTTKEMICFNTKVMDEHLPVAFDVLADLVLRPRFAEEDIAKEKQVVLEEIKMDEDNPDYLVHEIFTQHFWRGHALGRPILGTPETVPQFTQEALFQFFRRVYAPNNLVITAAGNVEHARLRELVAREFAALQPAEDGFRDIPPVAQPQISLRSKRELEQVQICMGVPSFAMSDDRRYAAAVLNVILGSGMSSRLFQNIREKQGLAYAVFSELSPYRDTGVLVVSAGTARETTTQLLRSVAGEFRTLKQELVPADELRRAKDHLKGSLMLSLESTSARMTNLARQEIYFGRFFTLDEILAAIERVTADEVQQIARELFAAEQIGVAVLGNLDGLQVSPDHLAC